MTQLLNTNPFHFNQWRSANPDANSIKAKLLNITPEKSKPGSLTIHDKIDNMASKAVEKQLGMGLSRPIEILGQAGPMRLSNRGFIEDFHKLYYNQKPQQEKRQNELRLSRTGHGAQQIDFDLQDELIEQKIKDVADDLLRRSQHDLNSKLNQRSKQMRDYIDIQLQKNGHAIKSLKDDMQSSERQIQRDLRRSNIEMSGSFDFKKLNAHPSLVQTSTDDNKTRILKKTLASDIQMSVLAQKIQCKPIEGHDLPISELQRKTLSDLDGSSTQKAQLITVENLNSLYPNEIKPEEQILSMLLPNQLKKNTMEFLDIEDIKTVKDVKPPKTQAQKDRENYEEMLEKDRLELLITDEHRQKTMKCLLKCLDFQLKDIEAQADHIDQNFKRNDKELKDFEMFLKKEENRLIMEGINEKMNKAKKQLETYDNYDPERDDGKELAHIADLVVENKLLLERVDMYLGKGESNKGDLSTTQDDFEDEESKFSESFINQMYKQVKKQAGPGKFKPASINVQFGKPIVDTHLNKNKKTLKKSKSRPRPEKSPVGVKVLSQDLQKIKNERKQDLKKKIEQKLTPTKVEKVVQHTTQKNKPIDEKLNRHIKSAMDSMANVMKAAFQDQD
ncbi:UNKNOWN [Stylonychia lemnae]|uniref:Uncharacterized protein n=1 Tax=Stylonychia lemnae TaxID=5949 RepID=A0A078BA59_STYLE|nr:UNKNOWN [Stylonychia lemnae]|eukprot:CDW91304.1 UNKNOWN [Stylonychia lemnae]